MNRAFAFLALVGLVSLPRYLGAQDAIPDSLRGSALSIRIHAVVPFPSASMPEAPSGTQPKQAQSAPSDQGGKAPQGDKASAPDKAPASIDTSTGQAVAWQGEGVKYTLPGRPAPFKFKGSNFVTVVQVTPFAQDDGKNLTLVVHGQVWVQGEAGKLLYYSALDTLSVAYGETVLFYPLGIDAGGRTPLRLEIAVFRGSDQGGQDEKALPGNEKASPAKGPQDKAPSDKAPADKSAK